MQALSSYWGDDSLIWTTSLQFAKQTLK